MNRQQLSNKYVHGKGLEIAGLHNPWPTCETNDSTVIQLDLFPTSKLRAQYPEMRERSFVQVQILDDGNYLKAIADNSMDFLFSSHVLEHMENVVAAVMNWLRVVKPGCPVLMAIPQKNNQIDMNREVTPFSHIWYEWKDGLVALERTRPLHYEEYFKVVDHLHGLNLSHRICEAMKEKPHIHWHCWDVFGIQALFEEIKSRVGGFDIVEFIHSGHEVFVVLRKNE